VAIAQREKSVGGTPLEYVKLNQGKRGIKRVWWGHLCKGEDVITANLHRTVYYTGQKLGEIGSKGAEGREGLLKKRKE